MLFEQQGSSAIDVGSRGGLKTRLGADGRASAARVRAQWQRFLERMATIRSLFERASHLAYLSKRSRAQIVGMAVASCEVKLIYEADQRQNLKQRRIEHAEEQEDGFQQQPNAIDHI